MLSGGKKVPVQLIESTRLIGSKLIMVLINNQRNEEIEINLDLLYVKDMDLLFSWLSLQNISVTRI
jgi:hypothetical protein